MPSQSCADSSHPWAHELFQARPEFFPIFAYFLPRQVRTRMSAPLLCILHGAHAGGAATHSEKSLPGIMSVMWRPVKQGRFLVKDRSTPECNTIVWLRTMAQKLRTHCGHEIEDAWRPSKPCRINSGWRACRLV